MALEDAELSITDDIAERVGVWIGSGIGGMQTYEEQFKRFIDRGYRRVSPFFVPMMIPDMAAGQVSIQRSEERRVGKEWRSRRAWTHIEEDRKSIDDRVWI